MGKSRTESQRIGHRAESLFKLWAGDHRLLLNKVSDDFGVDFYCQVLEAMPEGHEASRQSQRSSI